MGNKILIAIVASLGLISAAFADNHEGDEKKPFSIYGDFAASYNFHDNEGNHTNTNGAQDDLALDFVELNVEKNWSKSKLHVSIAYGHTALQFLPNIATTAELNLGNAYYALDTSYGLGVMVGQYESVMGYESFNHMDNSQYSRSWGYALVPYTEQGLGLTYSFDMVDLGFYVADTSAGGRGDADNNKTMTLAISAKPMDNLALDLNYLTGIEAVGAVLNTVSVIDFTAAFMINEMFDVALNYTDRGSEADTTGAQNEKANSIAAYVNANLGMFGLGLRYEMFKYDDGANNSFMGGLQGSLGPNAFAAGKTENTINSITLTAGAEIDQNAKAILEYKTDSSDEKIWNDKDGVATDSQSTITLGVMYRF